MYKEYYYEEIIPNLYGDTSLVGALLQRESDDSSTYEIVWFDLEDGETVDKWDIVKRIGKHRFNIFVREAKNYARRMDRASKKAQTKRVS